MTTGGEVSRELQGSETLGDGSVVSSAVAC